MLKEFGYKICIFQNVLPTNDYDMLDNSWFLASFIGKYILPTSTLRESQLTSL